ncbi:Flp family type IVb pilin [Bauldia sp.]|uniref:Flp family type IVb pilin n=1 Tax=Bauldia sp. TaxID=2575872 RepID=UPI003BA9D70B
MKNLLARFGKDEPGATAIEYGLIASLIAIGIIVGATAIGTYLTPALSEITAKMTGQ